MVPTLQLLQVLVVNQPLLPQVLEQVEVRSAGAKLVADVVVACDVLHSVVPRNPSVLSGS